MNAEKQRDMIVQAIKDWFSQNAPLASAVIGISGGKDSTIAAALLVRALGKERVYGVLMPCGIQPDIDDSKRVVQVLGINQITVNIQKPYEDLQKGFWPAGIPISKDAQVNLQPRIRMATLYMVAQSLPTGGIVINTCNRSEDYVGYATKFGDCAGDISILGDLLVSQVLEIGDTLEEIPKDLVHKTPSDGLWGDSDEDRLGFTYDQLEDYILKGTTANKEIDEKILHLHKTTRHKYTPMPSLSQQLIK